MSPESKAKLYFVGAILATLVLSTLFCRNRIKRKKRSFFLTALAGAVIANAVFFALTFLSGRLYADGWHAFSSEAWKNNADLINGLKSILVDAMIFMVVGTFFCIFPALAVACYYERRSKKDETHTH
jgi:thiamine transporter ThiT